MAAVVRQVNTGKEVWILLMQLLYNIPGGILRAVIWEKSNFQTAMSGIFLSAVLLFPEELLLHYNME